MNKYQHHTKSFLDKNLRKNKMSPILDEVWDKGILEDRDRKIMKIFGVSRKLFEILTTSDLTAEDKALAVALFNILNQRMGDK